jgi:hypothetical protein
MPGEYVCMFISPNDVSTLIGLFLLLPNLDCQSSSGIEHRSSGTISSDRKQSLISKGKNEDEGPGIVAFCAQNEGRTEILLPTPLRPFSVGQIPFVMKVLYHDMVQLI